MSNVGLTRESESAHGSRFNINWFNWYFVLFPIVYWKAIWTGKLIPKYTADCNNLQTLLALAMLCNQAALPAKDRIAPAPGSQLMWGKAFLPLHCGNIGMAISVKCSSGRKYRSFARAASLSASLSVAGLCITHNFPFLSKVGQNTPQTGILAGFCSKLQTAALSPAANASVILGRERYCFSQQACAPPKNTPSQNWKIGFEWWWMGSKLQTVAKKGFNSVFSNSSVTAPASDIGIQHCMPWNWTKRNDIWHLWHWIEDWMCKSRISTQIWLAF